MAMLSEAQIKRVWDGMLGAEIRALHFAELVSSRNAEQKFLTWSTLFLSSGAFLSIVATVPDGFEWIRPVLAAFVAALSLFSVVRQNQETAIKAGKLHSQWRKVAQRYIDIWENVHADDAKEKLDSAVSLEMDASEASTGFPYKESLMLKWERHVVSDHGLQLQN